MLRNLRPSKPKWRANQRPRPISTLSQSECSVAFVCCRQKCFASVTILLISIAQATYESHPACDATAITALSYSFLRFYFLYFAVLLIPLRCCSFFLFLFRCCAVSLFLWFDLLIFLLLLYCFLLSSNFSSEIHIYFHIYLFTSIYIFLPFIFFYLYPFPKPFSLFPYTIHSSHIPSSTLSSISPSPISPFPLFPSSPLSPLHQSRI